jgi:hypothetical protein
LCAFSRETYRVCVELRPPLPSSFPWPSPSPESSCAWSSQPIPIPPSSGTRTSEECVECLLRLLLMSLFRHRPRTSSISRCIDQSETNLIDPKSRATVFLDERNVHRQQDHLNSQRVTPYSVVISGEVGEVDGMLQPRPRFASSHLRCDTSSALVLSQNGIGPASSTSIVRSREHTEADTKDMNKKVINTSPCLAQAN